MLGFSASFHIVFAQSEVVHARMLACDLSGIVLAICGGTDVTLWLLFRCQPNARIAYLVVFNILCAALLPIATHPTLRHNQGCVRKHTRTQNARPHRSRPLSPAIPVPHDPETSPWITHSDRPSPLPRPPPPKQPHRAVVHGRRRGKPRPADPRPRDPRRVAGARVGRPGLADWRLRDACDVRCDFPMKDDVPPVFSSGTRSVCPD